MYIKFFLLKVLYHRHFRLLNFSWSLLSTCVIRWINKHADNSTTILKFSLSSCNAKCFKLFSRKKCNYINDEYPWQVTSKYTVCTKWRNCNKNYFLFSLSTRLPAADKRAQNGKNSKNQVMLLTLALSILCTGACPVIQLRSFLFYDKKTMTTTTSTSDPTHFSRNSTYTSV